MKTKTLLSGGAVAGLLLIASVEPAFANTFEHAAAPNDLPFVELIDTLAAAISGPIAQALGIMAMIAFGLMFSYGEGGSASRKGMGVLFGLAVAFNAAGYFVNTFFGFQEDGFGASFAVEAPLESASESKSDSAAIDIRN